MKILALAALALASAPALANESISPDKVISVVTTDWNSDGSVDRAVLVEGEEDADLYIYLSAPVEGNWDARKLVLFKKDAAWQGGMWGTSPSLSLNEKGSLLVKSENDAIGRNRWSQTLTVALKNGVFVVAGYTYSDRDTLDPNAGGSCDVNILTGQGIRNKKRFKSAPRVIALADWNDESAPKECQQ